MMLVVWAVIAIAVLLSVLLIYLEHEWGVVLGGATAVILLTSYFAAELFLRSPLVVLMPQGAQSRLDIMAIAACVLFGAALIVVAFLAGRNSASKNEPENKP